MWPGYLRVGWGVFHVKGVGAKKFGMSLETKEIKHFWREIRDFAGIFRRRPKSLRKKVCVQFLAPYKYLIQESPRQTKPKKGQFMNFSRGQTGTKFQCESRLFSQGKLKVKIEISSEMGCSSSQIRALRVWQPAPLSKSGATYGLRVEETLLQKPSVQTHARLPHTRKLALWLACRAVSQEWKN